MAKYKLLKDLPTFKAGDMFYMSEYGDLIYDGDNVGIKTCTWQILERFPNILTDWFEEIQEEPTDSIHWKPRIGEKCFILENANIRPTLFTGMLRDYNAWRTGKVFRTEEECEKARDRELAEVRLRRTSEFKPDFKNKNTGNGYVVGYDYLNKKLFIERVLFRDYGEAVYYETKEEAKISVEENREDWLTYFGIEEEK